MQSQHGDRPLYKGPIHFDATLYFKIPKTRKDLKEGDFHFYKPDVDNVIKFLLDVCNFDILFHDDCTVSIITCKKVYSHDPRVEFTIEELDNDAAKKTYNTERSPYYKKATPGRNWKPKHKEEDYEPDGCGYKISELV